MAVSGKPNGEMATTPHGQTGGGDQPQGLTVEGWGDAVKLILVEQSANSSLTMAFGDGEQKPSEFTQRVGKNYVEAFFRGPETGDNLSCVLVQGLAAVRAPSGDDASGLARCPYGCFYVPQRRTDVAHGSGTAAPVFCPVCVAAGDDCFCGHSREVVAVGGTIGGNVDDWSRVAVGECQEVGHQRAEVHRRTPRREHRSPARGALCRARPGGGPPSGAGRSRRRANCRAADQPW
ncbi:hypothetical protein AB0A70_05790 [Streptomyces morookaense]|uniref:hypothetical protein n=1 Tax=Streptomyces morookaense TaxID=1970 RepID=UPI0033CDF1B4